MLLTAVETFRNDKRAAPSEEPCPPRADSARTHIDA
jgi:hypothetical protein